MSIEARSENPSRTLFMAAELGGKSWKLGFALSLGAKPRLVTIPAGCTQSLEAQIRKAKQKFGLLYPVRPGSGRSSACRTRRRCAAATRQVATASGCIAT